MLQASLDLSDNHFTGVLPNSWTVLFIVSCANENCLYGHTLPRVVISINKDDNS